MVVIALYEQLFVWVVVMFNEFHGVCYSAVFMSIVDYMEHIC